MPPIAGYGDGRAAARSSYEGTGDHCRGHISMEPTKEELERRLAALDEAIVMLRAESPGREQLRAAFVAAADDIVAVAGRHRPHVVTRLQGILVANGLSAT